MSDDALRREPPPFRPYSIWHRDYLFHVVADPEAEATRSYNARTAHDDWIINSTARLSKARMRDQTVWSYTADGLPHSIFLTPEQAEALELPKP